MSFAMVWFPVCFVRHPVILSLPSLDADKYFIQMWRPVIEGLTLAPPPGLIEAGVQRESSSEVLYRQHKFSAEAPGDQWRKQSMRAGDNGDRCDVHKCLQLFPVIALIHFLSLEQFHCWQPVYRP